MSAYDDAEASVEDSEPRELFVISINDGVQVWRHTSATRDISYGGNVYTVLAMDRDNIAITMPGKEKDLTLTLPIDHAFVKRWLQLGIPPLNASLTVYRQNGGETRTKWAGDIASLGGIDKGVAKFRVPSRAGEWMLRPIPSMVASRSCPHFLFDTNCGVARTEVGPTALPHRQITTVIYVNGRDVRVDLPDITAGDPLRDDWADQGELYHPSTGERMTVQVQTDLNPGTGTVADLRLQFPVVGLKVGDTVHVFAGCRLDITTCRTKFDNKQRFGGAPQMPLKNPFTPAGWGILDNV